ncbi:MAG: hypothetical protein N2644_03015 [Candidatus Sumerlaea chitinivorans]|nr:hypothetical protein [Candidatus Sumerlaea chitinivorans]
MRRSIIQTIVLFLLFVGFFSTAVTLQHRNLEKVRLNPPFVETWLLSGRSGEMLRVLALRYDLVAADFLWLRAIQSFGGRGMTNRDWRPIYNMFDTITELDPYFENAYTFGNMVVGDEGGHQREALELLNKGMFRLIRQYRIPFEGMYVAHWQMGDLKLARWYGRIASKRQDAPDWVPRIAAYIEVKAGSYYIGYDRFLGNLLQAVDGNDVVLQRIALEKLKEAIHKWNTSLLLRAIDEYTSSTGRSPRRVEDLAQMPELQNYEVARLSKIIAAVERRARAIGRDQGIHPDLLKEDVALPSPQELTQPLPPDSEAKSGKTLQDLRNEIFREGLVRQSGIPEDPYGSRYVLNLSYLGYPWGKREDAVSNEKRRDEFLQTLLNDVRKQIELRRKMLGRLPESLREVFHTDFNTTEPAGGTWSYNPATGDFRSSTRPDL